MAKKSGDMFGDRRNKSDRRQQDLPMPAGLDRRLHLRRAKAFQHKPWWLNVDYSEELISVKASELLNKENIRVRLNDDSEQQKTSND